MTQDPKLTRALAEIEFVAQERQREECRMTATPSQEWTARDDRDVGLYAKLETVGSGKHRFVVDVAIAFAREILRLRAENERLIGVIARNVEKMSADGVEIERLTENYSGAGECLDMVREVLAMVLGEEAMKGTPPMFYPEAIRSALYRAATGKLPVEMLPPDALQHEMTRRHASLAGALGAEAYESEESLLGRACELAESIRADAAVFEELDSLRSQLAATREGETPDGLCEACGKQPHAHQFDCPNHPIAHDNG